MRREVRIAEDIVVIVGERERQRLGFWRECFGGERWKFWMAIWWIALLLGYAVGAWSYFDREGDRLAQAEAEAEAELQAEVRALLGEACDGE